MRSTVDFWRDLFYKVVAQRDAAEAEVLRLRAELDARPATERCTLGELNGRVR